MTKRKRPAPDRAPATVVEEFGPDERALYDDVKHVLQTHLTHNRCTPQQAENVLKTALHNVRLDNAARHHPEES